MATEGINKIFCGTDVKNTGVCSCAFDPKLIKGAILVPKDLVLTNTQLADANIQATLEGLVEAARTSRIFPFQNFVNITNNSEEAVQQTFGYGPVETVRDGNLNWLFQFRKGGIALLNALRSFNGLTEKYRLLLIEQSNVLIGTSRTDANGDPGLGGIPLENLYTNPWSPATGSELAVYTTNVVMQPVYINELIAFKKVATTSYLLSELTGLQDVVLTVDSVDTDADEVVITAATDCGNVDLNELYGDELAENTAWVYTDADGVAKTITGVTNENGGWTIAISEEVEDGDLISLAAPAVLAAAPINVSGYESNTVTVEVGS
jgi:hypothetical protein